MRGSLSLLKQERLFKKKAPFGAFFSRRAVVLDASWLGSILERGAISLVSWPASSCLEPSSSWQGSERKLTRLTARRFSFVVAIARPDLRSALSPTFSH